MTAKFRLATSWVTPALTSPFTTFQVDPAYRRDDAGNVHIRGSVTLNGAADGDLIFTLPATFRPSAETRVSQDSVPPTTSSCRVVVSTNGQVRAYKKEGTPTSYYLDCVFSAT